MDVQVHPGTLRFLDAAGMKTEQTCLLESMHSPDTHDCHVLPLHMTISRSFFLSSFLTANPH